MKFSMRSARSIFGAAAVAISAVALPAAALAAPAQGGHAGQLRHPKPAGISQCKSYNTATWFGLGEGGGGAGTFFYPLEFSNIGHRTCFLYGYPGVSAVSNSGKQIGSTASHAGPKRVVVLRPGATAHAILGIVDAGNIAGCHIRNGAFLKVFAPGQKGATTIPAFTFTACSNKSVLRVNAIRAGTGIPGFTTS
jgi:hypothetical protein